MPYKSGTWGPEAQERSKTRIGYFRAYNNRRYEFNGEEIRKKAAEYYDQNRKDILAKKAKEYELNDELRAKNADYYLKNRESIRAKQAGLYYQKRKILKK